MFKRNFDGYELFESERNFDFAKRSSIGCGKKAPIAFYPKTEMQCIALLRRLDRDGVEYRIAGNLTNVLPPNENAEFAVVSTKRLREVYRTQNGLFVSAGVSSYQLLSDCKQHGLGGVEFLAGVPCTMGGALFMNAGAAGRYIAEAVESVRIYTDGKVSVLPVNKCGYAYKTSAFMDEKIAILGANLCLRPTAFQTVSACIQSYLQRRAHLPKGRSMGCVFKNPTGKSAGELIENCGCKGWRVGGAFISEIHANFIINDGSATTDDIKKLIALIKNKVWEEGSIQLEEEIQYW